MDSQKDIKIVNNKKDLFGYYQNILSTHNWYFSKVPSNEKNIKFNIFLFEEKVYIVVLNQTVTEYNNEKMKNIYESELFSNE